MSSLRIPSCICGTVREVVTLSLPRDLGITFTLVRQNIGSALTELTSLVPDKRKIKAGGEHSTVQGEVECLFIGGSL